ncbi:MAG: acyltransferase [Elusimicrobia bacterium]|nr:acyltransferase [Elusimicrobiota bacterium]
MKTVRCALTQTCNAYGAMPDKVDGLASLAPRLEEVRRANVAHNVQLIEEAKGMGAKVVCLGELFPAPYFALTENPMWLQMAEDALKGPTAKEICKAAYENAMIVVAPLYELDAKTGRRYNTAVVVDERGVVLGRYRKTHIPCGANEKGKFTETFYYGPGDPPDGQPYFPVFETSAGRLGVNICYDRHFEGVVRSLARAGAEIVFSPAVTFGAKSRRMWEHEFIVDASRHKVFIGGSNRLGTEKPFDQEYFGGSYFAGPDGVKLANYSKHPNLVVSDLDMDVLRQADSSGWDLARDERAGIYSR